MIKTAGIVCDNYKLKKYEYELKKQGFTFSVVPFTKNESTIKVVTDSDSLVDIKKICEDLEKYFLTLKN